MTTLPLTPFNRLYDETMTLLLEARVYAQNRLTQRHYRQEPGIAGLRSSCDALRLTTRLANVMAWVLAQRAVAAGEIENDDETRAHYALDDLDVVIEEDEDLRAKASDPWLGGLLDRSHKLYHRVARLDRGLRDYSSAGPFQTLTLQ